jgi:hypothetical protein
LIEPSRVKSKYAVEANKKPVRNVFDKLIESVLIPFVFIASFLTVLLGINKPWGARAFSLFAFGWLLVIIIALLNALAPLKKPRRRAANKGTVPTP